MVSMAFALLTQLSRRKVLISKYVLATRSVFLNIAIDHRDLNKNINTHFVVQFIIAHNMQCRYTIILRYINAMLQLQPNSIKDVKSVRMDEKGLTVTIEFKTKDTKPLIFEAPSSSVASTCWLYSIDISLGSNRLTS